jgi:hypothetical protein
VIDKYRYSPTTASVHVLCNSLFTYHLTIVHYTP